MTRRRLVLVGAGRAHLYVLRELVRRPIADLDVAIVAPSEPYHSAMVAGYLQGQYAAAELRFDLRGLAARAGATFVQATPHRVDVAERVVIAGGERLPFDVCSLDLGCEAADIATPGVAAHAIPLQPAERVLELRERLDALIVEARPISIVVVGGGDLAVESALAIKQRLSASSAPGNVALVDRGTELLIDYEPEMRKLATEVLRARGVSLVLGDLVQSVDAASLRLRSGATMPADLIVWAETPCAPAIVARSALPHDEEGFLLVDRSLRAVSGSAIWGAGDCVTVRDFPGLPKTSRYTVRFAPTLDRSLRSALGQGRPGRYRPQRSPLMLLNTAGGWALMQWKGVHSHSRWACRLKDMIDRRFVRRFRGSDEKPRSGS
jgi:NADH dehydrogenase FAD-containing subunit